MKGQGKGVMKQNSLQAISDYIDLSLWNEFQESLHTTLDISIALYNTDGTLFAPPGRVDTVSELIEKRTTRGLELYRGVVQEGH